jgi:AcrR family transcriptional regulator
VKAESGTPLRADAARNRRLVLTTADRLFARDGLEVTLNDIAHEAGIGVGTVYRRFADKQALIDALFAERFEAFQDLAAGAAEDPDPGQALCRYLLDTAQWRARDRALEDIFARASVGTAPVHAMRAALALAVDGLVERAREAHAVDDDFASADVYTFLFMVGAVADRTRGVAPDAWRRYANVLLTGFGLRPAQATTAPALTDSELLQTWPAAPERRPAPGSEPSP